MTGKTCLAERCHCRPRVETLSGPNAAQVSDDFWAAGARISPGCALSVRTVLSRAGVCSLGDSVSGPGCALSAVRGVLSWCSLGPGCALSVLSRSGVCSLGPGCALSVRGVLSWRLCRRAGLEWTEHVSPRGVIRAEGDVTSRRFNRKSIVPQNSAELWKGK